MCHFTVYWQTNLVKHSRAISIVSTHDKSIKRQKKLVQINYFNHFSCRIGMIEWSGVDTSIFQSVQYMCSWCVEFCGLFMSKFEWMNTVHNICVRALNWHFHGLLCLRLGGWVQAVTFMLELNQHFFFWLFIFKFESK